MEKMKLACFLLAGGNEDITLPTYEKLYSKRKNYFQLLSLSA